MSSQKFKFLSPRAFLLLRNLYSYDGSLHITADYRFDGLCFAKLRSSKLYFNVFDEEELFIYFVTHIEHARHSVPYFPIVKLMRVALRGFFASELYVVCCKLCTAGRVLRTNENPPSFYLANVV